MGREREVCLFSCPSPRPVDVEEKKCRKRGGGRFPKWARYQNGRSAAKLANLFPRPDLRSESVTI